MIFIGYLEEEKTINSDYIQLLKRMKVEIAKKADLKKISSVLSRLWNVSQIIQNIRKICRIGFGIASLSADRPTI